MRGAVARLDGGMGSWLLWTIVAAAFTLGELHTNSFYLAPFAVGGAVAAILAALGAGSLLALLAFAGAAILFLMLLRPVARRHRLARSTLRTGAAALIGQPAVIVGRVSNREGVGTVKIGGEIWSARAYPDQELAVGEPVTVMEIRGATALVMPE